MKKTVIIDFSGTLIKADVAEQANALRYELLRLPLPESDEHKRLHGTKGHYIQLREAIQQEFGVHEAMNVTFRNNRGEDLLLSGKEVNTMIMTDLFRLGMYRVAHERGLDIFTPGMLGTLAEIQRRGYALAIVSGIRTDIITGVLAITGCQVEFDYVLGQDAILSRDDNELQGKELLEHGPIAFVIGDKQSDLEPVRGLDAASVFLRGGHPTGGEEIAADHVIDSPDELLTLIK